MSLAEQEKLELEKAEAFAAEVPRMRGIENIRVELGTDYDGDRVLTLTFMLAQELTPNDQWITEFNRYSGDIQDRILHSDIDRFPHVSLRRAA